MLLFELIEHFSQLFQKQPILCASATVCDKHTTSTHGTWKHALTEEVFLIEVARLSATPCAGQAKLMEM